MTPPLSKTPSPSPSLPQQEKRWKPISNGGLAYEPHDIITNGRDKFLDVQIPKADAHKICDAHNATLSEPKLEGDLGEKEPSSALTHVLQNALKEELARRGLDVDACVAKIEATVLKHLRDNPLPCFFPSCDSRACRPDEQSTVKVEETGGGFVAECEVCCSGTGTFATRDEAIDEWNQVAGAVLRGTSVVASNVVLPPPVSATVVGDEEIARELAHQLFLDEEEQDAAVPDILTAIRKAKSLSEPKEQKSLGEPREGDLGEKEPSSALTHVLQNPLLRKTLKDIGAMLALQPIECLGYGDDGLATHWPIRDEVISNINKALASQ